MDQQHLNDRQFAFLIYSGTVGNMLFITIYVIQNAGRATYVAAFLGSCVTALFMLWTIYLGKFMPKKSMFDIIKTYYGKMVSSILIMIYSLFHIFTGALILRLSMTIFVKVQLLHLTPLWLITLMPVIAIAIFLFTNSFNLFARWNVILQVVATSVYFVGIVVGMVIKFDVNNLKPVFHVDASDFLLGFYLLLGATNETVLKSFSIMGLLKNYKVARKGLIKGAILYIPIISTSLFFAIGIMGQEVARDSTFAIVNLANQVGLGKFIQGLEIFHILPFLSLIYIHLGHNAYSSFLSACSLSHNKKFRLIMIGIICIGIYAIAISITSFNVAMVYMKTTITYVVVPFSLLILIMASIAVIMRKRKKQ
ncbi:GerAB/ArcD/ProY family transporter [Vallitalea pronyensis]|uniref:GerAB/ArcD/ProY family transporter n=1 Tax=Vallitalea pronyensis TaxID=1348613 RepID=A0A8J8MNG1_9FIRM|nr:GerAB/ArcD/ProY family transporter [Vallitalea pronyensis]QUI24679.1 GerAB/ArcD/ProY family transporter [Vallitalea pronyensis]